jgi:uncharacterized iron-regulated protein
MFPKILATILLISTPADALPAREAIWDSRAGEWITVSEAAARIGPNATLLMGEEHAVKGLEGDPSTITHHENHLRLGRAIHAHATPLSVGMEFVDYTRQSVLDSFFTGLIDRNEFRNLSEWSDGNVFEIYEQKILLPRQTAGTTIALNIPRSVTRAVARLGPGGLTEAERALLPPIWEEGRPEYRERFADAMGGHGTKESLDRYFWAQSLWDDTMAWRVREYRSHSSLGALMVIVGRFHVEYGHGLASRLERYGVQGVRTMIQTEVAPGATWPPKPEVHPTYGAPADFIWYWSLEQSSSQK